MKSYIQGKTNEKELVFRKIVCGYPTKRATEFFYIVHDILHWFKF